MYLSGQWYHLTAKAELTKDDPVEGLDVAYLQREFLRPYLDIQDPKTSKRIRYVGGIRGLSELERMVDHVKETQAERCGGFFHVSDFHGRTVCRSRCRHADAAEIHMV